MKNKGMIIVAVVATLLLPLVNPGEARIASSHDVVDDGKLDREPHPALRDRDVVAADLGGITLETRVVILAALLLITSAATTDVVNGEVKRRRMDRFLESRHARRRGILEQNGVHGA